MSFYGELKHRNVVKAAALYVVASRLILQVADVLFDALVLPYPAVIVEVQHQRRGTFLGSIKRVIDAGSKFGWFGFGFGFGS